MEFIKQIFGVNADCNMIILQFKWLLFCPLMTIQLFIHWRAIKSFTTKKEIVVQEKKR